MITTTITLCAIPGQLWHENTAWGNAAVGIQSFIEDALGIEKRIQKGVNRENERMRYNLCCDRIEAAVKHAVMQAAEGLADFEQALAVKKFPVTTLSHDYLDAIRLIYQKSETKAAGMRLGATFFPPQLLQAHIATFELLANALGLSGLPDLQRRIAFFQTAVRNQCGVVEIQNPFVYQEQVATPNLAAGKADEFYIQNQADEDDEIFENEGRKAYDILHDQIARALQNTRVGKPCSVNFSNQPHNIITDILYDFAYSSSGRGQEPTCIQVVYTDGSQAADIPLMCLERHSDKDLQALAYTPPLKAALLSMRHLEMDERVDFSWLRNREVSKARTFAETDQFCYEETKRLLADTRDEGPFVLHLYQTGLQPAVIGFYRALIEELLYRSMLQPSLEVVPYYHGKSGYWQGHIWH